MNRKLIFYFLLTHLFVLKTIAQTNMANGNSGAVSGLNGSANAPGNNIYSPDLFTGTVNVNIPIYNYSVDGLDLGISLTYNTLGIKVDQTASDIGLGWTLNTGGIITREVHGLEDELTESEIDTLVPGTTSTYKTAVGEQRGSWVDNRIAGTGPESTVPGVGPHFVNEREPDVFTAVLGNRTIKFCLNNYSDQSDWHSHLMTVYTSPKSNIWVDVYFTDTNIFSGMVGGVYTYMVDTFAECLGTNRILRFKITDEKGNQFFFDRGDYEQRYYSYKTFNPTTFIGDQSYDVPYSWVLKKVITYTGAIVKYDYVDDAYNYPGYLNQVVREGCTFFDGTSTSTVPAIPGNIAVINDEINLSYKSKRISQITYPDGDIVKFNTDGNARIDQNGGGISSADNQAISNITIQNGYDPSHLNIFTYRLNHAYFNSYIGTGTPLPSEVSYPSNTIPDAIHNLRLKLTGIDKIGTDNTTTENYYSFDYISNDPYRLPARLSGLTDCYGYSNGKPFPGPIFAPLTPEYVSTYAALFHINVPRHLFTFEDHSLTVFSAFYGRDLTPDWSYAQSGLLKTVTNGTGGSIQFTFQNQNLANPPDFSATSSTPESSSLNTGYFNIDDIRYNEGLIGPGAPYSPPTDFDFLNANDGVCISKIVCSDGYNVDNTTTTTFDFSNGSSGPGGLRFFPDGYFWETTWVDGNFADSATNQIIEKLYHNSFVTPMDLINGSNHGYTHARVTTTGYGGDRISDKAYTFTNLEPSSGETITNSLTPTTIITPTWSRLNVHCGLLTHTFPRITFDKSYMGLLKELDEYDNTGTIILSKTINTYNELVYPDSVSNYEGSDNVFSSVGIMCRGENSWGDPLGYINNAAFYSPFNNSRVHLTSSTVQNFSGGLMSQVYKIYEYNTYDDLWRTRYVDSKGNEISDINYYLYLPYSENYGYYGTFTKYLTYLGGKTKGIKYPGTSAVLTTESSDITSDYFSTATNCYDGLGNPVPYYPVGINITGPMGLIKFPKVHTFFGTAPETTLTTILAKHFTVYDDHSNVLETGYNNDQNYSSAIWDTRIGQKISDVKNSQYTDIAYTSFEGAFLPYSTPDYNKGNWKFDPGNVVAATTTDMAITGKYYFNLSGTTVESSNVPSPYKKYTVSLWYKGAVPVVFVGPVITLTNQLTANGWTLATGTFTGDGTSFVVIQTTGTTYLDEIRFHPIDAAMDTYTYEPLLGVSSHCDERNNITYFEYDAMGRPTITRDINGNIISLTKHIVQGTDY